MILEITNHAGSYYYRATTAQAIAELEKIQKTCVSCNTNLQSIRDEAVATVYYWLDTGAPDLVEVQSVEVPAALNSGEPVRLVRN